jgi:nitrogen fixation NifU-like protein
MCGDRITVRLRVDGVVQAIAWEGDGCSIMVASASMMMDDLINREGMSVVVRSVVAGSTRLGFPTDMAIEPVRHFPTRHKCAALPWEALREALSRD